MEENRFKLVTDFKPSGDQPKAIEKLMQGLNQNKQNQVLLGATGTGKTFTIANVIKKYNKQTLVLTPNKTLAMQFYLELKGLFPENKVEYFVSNFDFFQPEAYIASRDLYIDKDAKRNNDLEMLRLSAVNSLISRKDTIVVASVAAIYALGDPEQYSSINLKLEKNEQIKMKFVIGFLVNSGYDNTSDPFPGSFIHRGDVLNIYPGHTDTFYYRLSFFGDNIEDIAIMEPINNSVKEKLNTIVLLPAATYVTDIDKIKIVCENIKKELDERVQYFINEKKYIEADRLKKRTIFDIETLSEFGVCAGIENYSAHLDFRKPGETPFSLLDYFEDGFLTVIDESHIMIPQIKGMYNTSLSRLTNLVDYGFRLPSALDNRPLIFKEFEDKTFSKIYTSATPGDYEIEKVNGDFIQQIIRPTGLLDPTIEVRSTEGQMDDILKEIDYEIKNNRKVLITTLTIKMAEDLSDYIAQRGIKVTYLHSELKTIERTEVIYNLRKGVFDVIVGINLLREGLDIPEIGLVCILDADKSGFLRNTRSLIQTIGRAARNKNGRVLFYAYEISKAMQEAIDETQRRRDVQIKYNKENNITPQTINKEITKVFSENRLEDKIIALKDSKAKNKILKEQIKELRKDMIKASNDLDFESAAKIRDIIIELENK